MNEKEKCPNAAGCQVINIDGFVSDKAKREHYIHQYCYAGEASFSTCKRFKTKKSLGFCPDFVFPDTAMSLDEIMDKCEE